MSPPQVRERTDADVAEVVALLLRQQSGSRYPYRDPLPFAPELFVRRAGELVSWVTVLDGRVVGHVAVVAVVDDEVGRRWSEGTGRPVHDLGAVSVLVVDEEQR